MKSLLAFVCLGAGFIQAFAQFEKVKNHFNRIEKPSKNELQTIAFIQKEEELVENYEQLCQIIVVRHGELALDKKGWRSRKAAQQFIKDYDSVGVFSPKSLPVSLFPSELAFIHTGTIPRARSTAYQLYGDSTPQLANPLFREFERKIFSLPNIKLPLKWWLIGSRIGWMSGMNKRGIESFKEAKLRSMEASRFLSEDANQNRKTMLISHGFLNQYITKNLERNGWTLVYDGGNGYLSQKLLIKYQ